MQMYIVYTKKWLQCVNCNHFFGNNLINSELKIANIVPEGGWRHVGELFECPVEGYPVAETGLYYAPE